MNNSTKCVLIATGLGLGLFLSGPPTLAASDETAGYDVQSLYRRCKMPEASPELGICIGFISGVGAMMNTLGVVRHQVPGVANFAICGNPSYGAMVQAFLNWAEKNPREWGKKQEIGVATALGLAWPCTP
jgi:hypothetical protein